MFYNDNFIEYIGIEKIENNKKLLNKTSFNKIISFENVSDIDISCIYINTHTEDSEYIEEENIYFSVIRLDINIEYIDNDSFGEIQIKNYTFYKSIIYESLYEPSNIHNLCDYIKLLKLNINHFNLYVNISSIIK